MPEQKRRDELLNQFNELYGDKPKAIKIMFPPASPELFFAQFYKRYGKGALLKCKGDGDVAETMPDFAQELEVIGETERGFIQVVCKGEECPYQISNECGRMASLQVILPELSGIRVWQINTGSYNSIVNINSAIEWLRGLCGRFAMIPITFMRQEQDIAYEGKRSKHYILAIDQNVSIGEIQRFVSLTPVERALIPAPDERKDSQFYDANGKKPIELIPDEQKDAISADLSPDPETTSPTTPKDQAALPAASQADKPPIVKESPKGPLSQELEKQSQLRRPLNDLIAGIKTCKTREHAKQYAEELKKSGAIDKLCPEHQEELRNWYIAYMRGLKK